MAEELEIDVSPDGEVRVHIKGKGKACLEVAELFKKLVGPEKARKLGPEYYETDTHIRGDLRH